MECIPDPVTPAGDRWRFNSRGRRECGVVLDGRRIYTETNRRRAQGVRKFLERFSEGPWGASPSTLRQLLEHNDRLPDAPVSAPVPVIDQGRLQARRRRYLSRIGPVATYSTNNRTNAMVVVAWLSDIHPWGMTKVIRELGRDTPDGEPVP